MRFSSLYLLFTLLFASPLFFSVSGCLALTNLDEKLPDDDDVNDLPGIKSFHTTSSTGERSI
ncbi:MAG: hypothetical protein GY822_18460 [Deltaproteobacteria bacterium]|nr:hypothetical protein [Deltaproteobacteria bacterium]